MKSPAVFSLLTIVLTLGLACEKSTDTLAEPPTTDPQNEEPDPLTYSEWQALEACEKRAFDNWLIDSLSTTLRYGGGPAVSACEGICSVPEIDSIVFADTEAHFYIKASFGPTLLTRQLDCQDEPLSFEGLSGYILEAKFLQDTILHVSGNSPILHYAKGSEDFNYHWEVDFYLRMRTDSLDL